MGGYVALRMNNWGKVENTVTGGKKVKDPRGQGTGRNTHIDIEITRIINWRND